MKIGKKIKKINLRRLASLSALGAGAMGVSGNIMEASTIVFSGPVDETVGFGAQSHLRFRGPNGVGGVMGLHTFSVSDSAGHWVNLRGHAGAYGTDFRFLGAIGGGIGRVFALAFSRGAEWGGAACTDAGCVPLAAGAQPCDSAGPGVQPPGGQVSRGRIVLTGRGCLSTYFTNFNSKDKYLLFEFTGGKLPNTMYGWAELTVRGSDTTLVEWAYDTSGAKIPAGDTGRPEPTAPEPSTFVLTGLAAVALGARGMRAWRAARH